jgi:hypothetical protein
MFTGLLKGTSSSKLHSTEMYNDCELWTGKNLQQASMAYSEVHSLN